jgi:hypothetical protein
LPLSRIEIPAWLEYESEKRSVAGAVIVFRSLLLIPCPFFFSRRLFFG